MIFFYLQYILKFEIIFKRQNRVPWEKRYAN